MEAKPVIPVKPFDSNPYYYLAITLFVAIIGILSDRHFSTTFSVSKFIASLDDIFFPSGIFHKKHVMLDSFVAFISWSTTYLFIRRLLNPETSKVAIEKFSPDAFYG